MFGNDGKDDTDDEILEESKRFLLEDNKILAEYPQIGQKIEGLAEQFIEVIRIHPINYYELKEELEEFLNDKNEDGTDPLLVDGIIRIIQNDERVIVRNMKEIEMEELDDNVMPNEWIYHRDASPREVHDYIVNVYEELNKD